MDLNPPRIKFSTSFYHATPVVTGAKELPSFEHPRQQPLLERRWQPLPSHPCLMEGAQFYHGYSEGQFTRYHITPA